MPEHNRKPEGQDDFGLVRNDDVDFTPARRRKGVGPVRLVVSLVLLVAAAITFYVVLKHRLANPEVRVVRNAEDVMDESLAQAHAAGRTPRAKRSASKTKLTVIHRAVDAYDSICYSLNRAYECWESTYDWLPDGTITPGVAQAALDRLDRNEERLDEAKQLIDQSDRHIQVLLEASRAGGDKAYSLGRLYSATHRMQQFLSEETNLRFELLRCQRDYFQAIVSGSRGDRSAMVDAINGMYRKLQGKSEQHKRLAEEMDAADQAMVRKRA